MTAAILECVDSENRVMNEFVHGFITGARETPRAYFAPLIALWRLLHGTTEDLIAKHQEDRSDKSRKD